MAAPRYITLFDPANPAQPRHLAYYAWGNPASPAVICMHGLTRNGRDFDMLAEALSFHYHVICPDMAGRGKSDWLSRKEDYNYFTYVSDATALLEHLHLSQVAWVGTSMGGIIGMMLAAGQPGRISAMALNDIGSVVSARGLTRILDYAGTSGPFMGALEAMSYLKSILAPFGITSDPGWQRMFEASFTRLLDGSYALAYDPGIGIPLKEAAELAGKVSDVDLSLFWNAVLCPVLILRGAQSDILTRDTAQAMCARLIPTRLVEFEGVGHAPALMDEHQIRIIVDWLAQEYKTDLF